MSGTPQKPKAASRWGSLLSGAVAGLESRLDTILADDDQAAKGKAAEEAAKSTIQAQMSMARMEDAARASSRPRPNSRLQDRLAKAVNKPGEGTRPGSAASSEIPSRVASPALAAEGRASIDSKVSDIIPDAAAADSSISTPAGEGQTDIEAATTAVPTENGEQPIVPSITLPARETSPRPSHDSIISRPLVEASTDPTQGLDQSPRVSAGERDPETLLLELAQLRQEQTERKEEIHAHLERIDALQSKLQYLAKAAAETTHKAVAEASEGTPERKLAEKDEQVALLMEEGQKLAKRELAQSNAIKSLRIRNLEESKRAADAKQKLAKSEQSLQEANDRIKRAEAAEKHAQSKLKVLSKIEKDVDELIVEREAAASTIAELRRQIVEADRRAVEAEKKAQSGALEAERRAVRELTEDLENARIEKKLAGDRAKEQLREVREEASRNDEKAKSLEIELRSEITSLETKLEVLRTRSEDLTSSSTNDSQAKLLRQVETLQTQYALARENWETLESSLTSRLTAVEKERDDIAKRETDIRRKAREVNTKARRLEDELEEVNDRAKTLEEELETQRSQVTKLQASLSQVEKSLADAKAEFEREKKLWDAELLQRIEDERNKWRLEAQTPTETSFLRAESPTASFFRKQSQPDYLGSLYTSRRSNFRTNSSDIQPITIDGRPTSSGRRTSTQPLRTPTESVSRHLSATSLAQLNGTPPNASQAPSQYTGDLDEAPVSPSPISTSPHRTIADVISASNSNAGPSVQLVSSMSAAVRRLEAEKAASKEELARLTGQRDEAREEVVGLMKEVEEKRALGVKVDTLEKNLEEVQARYEASLELLGERQEEVEELKNDVLDLKQMLREMAESKAKR